MGRPFPGAFYAFREKVPRWDLLDSKTVKISSLPRATRDRKAENLPVSGEHFLPFASPISQSGIQIAFNLIGDVVS
jgi:hypothetical protein